MSFYSARLLFVVLVDDGCARKIQTWDESVVTFRAKDSEHAFARALELGKEHETEYFNCKEQ